MHIYVQISTFTYTHNTYMQMHIHVHTYIQIYNTHIYTCMQTCRYAPMQIYTYICTPIHIHTQTHLHAHGHIHTYRYIYAHITHMPSPYTNAHTCKHINSYRHILITCLTLSLREVLSFCILNLDTHLPNTVDHVGLDACPRHVKSPQGCQRREHLTFTHYTAMFSFQSGRLLVLSPPKIYFFSKQVKKSCTFFGGGELLEFLLPEENLQYYEGGRDQNIIPKSVNCLLMRHPVSTKARENII